MVEMLDVREYSFGSSAFFKVFLLCSCFALAQVHDAVQQRNEAVDPREL